MNSLVKLPD